MSPKTTEGTGQLQKTRSLPFFYKANSKQKPKKECYDEHANGLSE